MYPLLGLTGGKFCLRHNETSKVLNQFLPYYIPWSKIHNISARRSMNYIVIIIVIYMISLTNTATNTIYGYIFHYQFQFWALGL